MSPFLKILSKNYQKGNKKFVLAKVMIYFEYMMFVILL